MAVPIVGENRGNAGKGRPKGSLNRINASLKDMILGALKEAGGKSWLVQQAQENPVAFMALLAKLLPLELKQESAEPQPLTIRVIGGLPDE
jgi:hypothetical protein